MANSSLATYNANCLNRNDRYCKISKITPHYMAGNMTARNCADYFGRSGRQASCNYCIGSDGDIAVCVPEDYRAWTSSSEWNDQRAVTFECANIDANGTLTDACYKSLVALCADICKRHGINPHYDGTINGSITMHCQFTSTSCPGNWLKQKITSGQFEKDIKAKMGGSTASVTTPSTGSEMYRVRKSWKDAKSQIGAFKSLENAKKACKTGYKVFNSAGKQVYPSVTTWDINAVIKVGDTVKSKSCAIALIPGTSSAIQKVDGADCVNVPELGGLVPLTDISEAGDTKDGKKDDYLANTNSRVYLSECKVEAVSAQNNTVKVHGYWVSATPLMAKR